MTIPASQSQRNGGIWIVAFLFFVLPIFGVIWNGYHGVWADQLPELGARVHFTAATVTSLLIWVLSNVVSRYKLGAATATQAFRRYSWAIPYTLLFLVSGIGIFNAMYQTIEGRFILREKIEEVDFALKKLGADGKTVIDGSLDAYNQFTARLNSNLDGLRREIYNNVKDKTCGIGTSAEKIIEEIKKDLPQYYKMAGTGDTRCSNTSNLDRIWEQQKQLAENLCRDSHITKSADLDGKRRLAVDLDRSVEREQKKLRETRTHLLEGVQLLLDHETMQAGKTVIRDAALAYTDMHVRLSQVGPLNLPAKIDVSEAENLGKVVQSLSSALSRSSNGRIFAYLLIALLVDFCVIFVIQKLNELVRTTQARRISVTPTERPTFLWNPRRSEPTEA